MPQTTVDAPCVCAAVRRLSLDEPASYIEEPADGNVIRLTMFFNRPTLELLKRWRTKIRSTRWYRDGDYATLTVSPPLIPPITIKMWRTPARDAPKR